MKKTKQSKWKFMGVLPETVRPDICQRCPDCDTAMVTYETQGLDGTVLEGCHLCHTCHAKYPLSKSVLMPKDADIDEAIEAFRKWNYGRPI